MIRADPARACGTGMTEPETPPALIVHAEVASVGSGASGEANQEEDQADGVDI